MHMHTNARTHARMHALTHARTHAHTRTLSEFKMGTKVEDQQVSCLWQGSHLLSVSVSGFINYLDVDNPDTPLRVIKVCARGCVCVCLHVSVCVCVCGCVHACVKRLECGKPEYKAIELLRLKANGLMWVRILNNLSLYCVGPLLRNVYSLRILFSGMSACDMMYMCKYTMIYTN